jgi:Tfp pilus assembly protein PilX
MSTAVQANLKSRSKQRGATAMIVSVLLLFSSSLAILYLNRSLIFEQRTSANMYKASIAHQMAEAGIEWATGMLNTAYDIQESDCTLLSTTNLPFRKRYVQSQWGTTTAVVSVTNTFPGCKVNGTTMTCNCPTVTGTTTAASLGTSTLPGFTVAFADVSGDSESVKVTATGCTDLSTACYSTTKANADASASITVILKMRPLLRAAPSSTLSCGVDCNTGGSINITNTDTTTNGVLVNAGGSVTTGSGAYTTMAGIPSANAIVSTDTTLSALASSDTSSCSNSSMFKSYFGSTVAEYANSPIVKTITCTTAAACGTAVNAAVADGWRSFYFDSGFSWNNSAGATLGSASDPVTIVTNGALNINGNSTIFGLLFANSGVTNDVGTGGSTIQGALVTCRSYSNTGNGSLIYNSSVLTGVRRSTGDFVRVSGSWKDY